MHVCLDRQIDRQIDRYVYMIDRYVHKYVYIQSVSQDSKKFCVFHELANKMQLGGWEHSESLSEFRGGAGGKPHKTYNNKTKVV